MGTRLVLGGMVVVVVGLGGSAGFGALAELGARVGPQPLAAQEGDGDDAPELNSGFISGWRWQSIGPAVASGRIADIAVDPTDRSVWYVAASSGNVWR